MKNIPFVLGLLILASCQTIKNAAPSYSASDNRSLYRNAMSIAVYPDSSKIDTNLVVINEQNPNLIWKTFNNEKYLLVVSWKTTTSAGYYPKGLDSLYNTSTYPMIWVTTAPQLQNWFKQENPADTNLRLNQLLGLPPNAVYSYFVEFWVKPSDLFRPCPDNEITDNRCSTCFPANTDPAYVTWINESRISRYYGCDLYSQYPWTELGYTFDWNPANTKHYGMSEFVIKQNANVYVKGIYTNAEYLK